MNSTTGQNNVDCQEARQQVWITLADYFLDSDHRPDIPATALVCIDNTFDVDEVREIWMYEVTPALYTNLLDVAGQWGAWNRDWLFERIENHQAPRNRRNGLLPRLTYRLQIASNHEYLSSILKSMDFLLTLDKRDRERVKNELCWIAHVYFDHYHPGLSTEKWSLEEITELVDNSFFPIFQPIISKADGLLQDEALRLRKYYERLQCAS